MFVYTYTALLDCLNCMIYWQQIPIVALIFLDAHDCLYAWVTPFECTGDCAMKIVKVGATFDPGERLRDEWIAMNAVTKLQYMTLSDDIKKDKKIEDVIKSAKNHEKVLFIVCIKIPDGLTMKENRARVEPALRGVMGRSIGGPFMEQFMCKLKELEKWDKFSSRSGLTEWIICKEDTVKAIQGDFRNDSLDGQDTGVTHSMSANPKTPKSAWKNWHEFIETIIQLVGCAEIEVEIELSDMPAAFKQKVVYPK